MKETTAAQRVFMLESIRRVTGKSILNKTLHCLTAAEGLIDMIEEKTVLPNSAAPDEGCLKFLRALARWQGTASPHDLGPQIGQDENRARQKCKRRGWATYDGGYWRLTDDGRAYVRSLGVPVRA